MLYQKRIIEKRGLIVFDETERKALDLQVHCIVRQIPRNGIIRNYRLFPNRSWFGWATAMIGISTFKDIELQFENQCIYHYQRSIEQAAGIDMLNFDTILSAMQTLSIQITPPSGVVSRLPPVPVMYALCPVTRINFELPDGVVIEVQSHILILNEAASIYAEELANSSPPGDDSGVENPPSQQPPIGAPPLTKAWDDLISDAPFTISPPYDGVDDNGRTYKPPFVPPWDGEDGQDQAKRYKVTIEEAWFSPEGNSLNDIRTSVRNNVPGKILGLGTREPNNSDGIFGVLTSHPTERIFPLGSNYQYKVAWPPGFSTSYVKARIISIEIM